MRNCVGGGCGACCGGVCSGCNGELQLTQEELELLLKFAETPFLPLARRADSMDPVCLEEGQTETLGKSITGLSNKRLIRLDYDLPLTNFDYAAYHAYPHKGSMALTAMGQRVIELLDVQGIEA